MHAVELEMQQAQRAVKEQNEGAVPRRPRLIHLLNQAARTVRGARHSKPSSRLSTTTTQQMVRPNMFKKSDNMRI